MKKMLSVFALLAATTVAAVHVVSSQAPSPVPKQKEVKTDASALTQKQKHHRKFFQTSPGPKLRELAAKKSGDIITVTVEDPFTISMPDKELPKVLALDFTVCNAEAAVVGTLTNDSPQLTEDESFLFTEYSMNVEEVIKNSLTRPIEDGGSITVVREGGVGQINGRTVRAIREGFPEFSTGRRYLLFLRFIPETESYLAYPYGSFELGEGNKVIPFAPMPKGTSTDAASFLSAVRSAAATANCVGQ